MGKNLRTEEMDHLFEAILSLENKDECYSFFEDICTVNELVAMAQRFEVARMLRKNKTYLDIAAKTGASTATISRVNRTLNYGTDGYDMVLDRIANTEEQVLSINMARRYAGLFYLVFLDSDFLDSAFLASAS